MIQVTWGFLLAASRLNLYRGNQRLSIMHSLSQDFKSTEPKGTNQSERPQRRPRIKIL